VSVIQPIVEGHGEMEAAPVLLRRLQDVGMAYGFRIARPIRRHRSELVTEGQLRRSVQLALGTPEIAGILVLFDSDDDAVCQLGPQLQVWAQAEAGEVNCQVVLAKREYEAWFISSIESLRGFRGIATDATSHATPEGVRDAKSELETRMTPGKFYAPTTDQAAFSARVELSETHRRCRSFRKLTAAFGTLALAAGAELPQWPPAAWL